MAAYLVLVRPGLGFGIWDLGFGVERVGGWGVGAWGLGLKGFRVWGLGLGILGWGFRVSGLGLGVERVQDLGSRGSVQLIRVHIRPA